MKHYWGKLEDRRPWICSGGKLLSLQKTRTAPSERIDLDKDISRLNIKVF